MKTNPDTSTPFFIYPTHSAEALEAHTENKNIIPATSHIANVGLIPSASLPINFPLVSQPEKWDVAWFDHYE